MQNAMAVPLILPISLLSGESEVVIGAQWVRNTCAPSGWLMNRRPCSGMPCTLPPPLLQRTHQIPKDSTMYTSVAAQCRHLLNLLPAALNLSHLPRR
jgi:hypothetical protein